MSALSSFLFRTRPAPPAISNRSSSTIAFQWLLRLRWGAVACQLLLVFVVSFLFVVDIPLAPLMAIIGFEVVSNLAFHALVRGGAAIRESHFAAVLLLDIALLTALLYYSGGPMKPFTFLYLVHIALGATLMRPRWSWTLALCTTGAYALLFFLPEPDAAPRALGTTTLNDLLALCHVKPAGLELLHDPMAIHFQGMLVAFIVTAFFIVFFVGKTQKALDEHQQTLAELQEQKLRNEKLASLATLAAGAAHEFSTPLSTIAVAAGEMHHTIKTAGAEPELLADVTLIRSQVDRCREILYHMAADAGEHLGEGVEDFSLREAIDASLHSFPAQLQERVTVTNQVPELMVRLPFRTMSRIVRGLIKNGLDASPAGGPVSVDCFLDHDDLVIQVRDEGSGMDRETIGRAAEPFFTTKEPGRGLGLGLYLAKSAAERFGGTLVLASQQGAGTTVRLTFALRQIKAPAA